PHSAQSEGSGVARACGLRPHARATPLPSQKLGGVGFDRSSGKPCAYQQLITTFPTWKERYRWSSTCAVIQLRYRRRQCAKLCTEPNLVTMSTMKTPPSTACRKW